MGVVDTFGSNKLIPMKYLCIILWLMSNLPPASAQAPISPKMLAHFEEIESLIPYRDRLNEEVSQVDVAWHLYHSLKVVNNLYEALSASNPKEYRYQWSFMRGAIFLWGDFPRGIAKSPQSVVPPDSIATEAIYAQLAEARQKLEKYAELPPNSFYPHFAFKNINRDRSIRFLEVHTKHHLKIIRDILKDK